jgi:nucleoside-triphosphatase
LGENTVTEKNAAKHIFLTGERNVGKSTIIQKYCGTLDFVPGGFLTLPGRPREDGGDSIFIMPYAQAADAGDAEAAGDAALEVAVRKGGCAGVVSYPEAFDRKGAEILRKSRGAALIVMDELGFMEREALLFQRAVLDILDGDTPVLGVVKPTVMQKSGVMRKIESAFLDAVRAHPSAAVIEVTEENREAVYLEVAGFWR